MNCLVEFFLLAFISVSSAKHERFRRLTNTAAAESGEYPYQAAILVQGKHKCGGALVSNWHVITAVTCDLHRFNISEVKVVLGAVDPTTGDKRDIFRIANHPEFFESPTVINADIAVITLKKQVVENDNIQAIALPSPNFDYYAPGTRLIISGYGSDVLRKMYMYVLDTSNCRQLTGFTEITARQFCAFIKLGHGICDGDMGTPITYEKQVLVGIAVARRRIGCGTGPDLFERIQPYLDFINKELAVFV